MHERISAVSDHADGNHAQDPLPPALQQRQRAGGVPSLTSVRLPSCLDEEPANHAVPNRWQRETDCLVGPFSSHTVAEYFASSVVNTSDRTTTNEIFAEEDGWYLVVRRLDTPVKAVSNKNAEA